jgi:beta-glucanase (GH16 family)
MSPSEPTELKRKRKGPSSSGAVPREGRLFDRWSLLHRSRLGLAVLLGALVGVRAGWIDGDTPQGALSTKSFADGQEYELVMSDEFEVSGRTFEDGMDKRWTAMHKNDYTNAALHFYSRDAVVTSGGFLNISTVNEDVDVPYWDDHSRSVKHTTKTYASGMVQGWNKFCLSGGIVEVSAALPGTAYVGGLWPAMWLLGNLARATYTSSSDFQWPWSYDKCEREEEGKEKFQYQQEVSACDKYSHYGMEHHKGRGAPEIDILEAMPGKDPYSPWMVGKPYISTSYQVAPGFQGERPLNGKYPKPGLWYEDDMQYGRNTSQNVYFYGSKLKHEPPIKSYLADAISANHALEPTHFEDQHVYRLEWQPGEKGYIKWYVDDEFVFSMTQKTLAPTGAKIPDEPMYLLFNTAVSSMWGFPAPCDESHCGCDCWDVRDSRCACACPVGMDDLFPAHFLIDYVRVYQNPNDSLQKVGCSTDTHPTAKWIAGHPARYRDPQDDHILYSISEGGGSCRSNHDCGRSDCVNGHCSCKEGYTGPKCLSPDGFDDIVYEEDTTLPNLEGPSVPVSLAAILGALAACFAAACSVRASHLQQRLDYSKIDQMTVPPLMHPVAMALGA